MKQISLPAFDDAGYEGIQKSPDAKANVTWNVAMRPGKRKDLNKDNAVDALIDKAGAKLEHPFRVIKRQFGFVIVRVRGLKKTRPNSSNRLRCRTCGW